MPKPETFAGFDGYPCSFAETPFGMALIQAVAALPGAQNLSPEETEGKAALLYRTSRHSQNEELPRNRPASFRKSEKELRDLEKICGKLAAHVESMHRPAVGAIYQQGEDLFHIVETVERLRENLRWAFHRMEDEGPARGAGQKIIAAQVTKMARLVFESVSGREATRTTDPLTGAISGDWPMFLEDVFDALGVKASVSSQVKSGTAIRGC